MLKLQIAAGLAAVLLVILWLQVGSDSHSGGHNCPTADTPTIACSCPSPPPVSPSATRSEACVSPAIPRKVLEVLLKYPCCSPESTKDLSHVLARLALGLPFGYAHFNDGEIIAATSAEGATDRGMQQNSPRMKELMRQAIQTDVPGLFSGAPCRSYFGGATQEYHTIAKNRRTFTRDTIATLWIDGNYAGARAALLKILHVRRPRVHMVVSAEANMTRFTESTGIDPVAVHRVPSTEAFPAGYNALHDKWSSVMPGDVVFLAAGPLGRILGVEWFAARPCATVLEIGSFFDMDLLGRTLGADYYTKAKDSFGGCEHADDIRDDVDADAFEKLAADAVAGTYRD